MTIKPLTQAIIASALGVDKALVSRYRARGMPTNSVEAALAWKQANIRMRVGPTWVPEERAMAIGAGVEADDEVVCGKVNGPRMHALRRALRAMGYDEQLELTRRVWLELIRYYLHPETEVHTGRPSDRLTVDALARLIRPDYPMPEMWWYAACDEDDVAIHGWPKDDSGEDPE